MGTDASSPPISLIVPVHNRGRDLARSLASALGQVTDDVEVIVVDDASTDPSVGEVLATIPPWVAVHRLAENLGASAARNAGARRARGTWLVFLDSDDELLPDGVERIARGIEVAECGLVRFAVAHAAPGGRRDIEAFTPGSFAVRADLFWRVHGYDEALRFGENFDLIVRLEREMERDGISPVLVEQPTVTTAAFAASRDYSRDRMAGAIHVLERDRDLLREDPEVRERLESIVAVNAARAGEYGVARRYAWRAVRAGPSRPSNLARYALVLTGPLARHYWRWRQRRRG